MTKGSIFVVTGPSGVGKGTVLRVVREHTGIHFSVSATTRKPREGEENGRDYYFLEKDEFLRLIDEGRLLEHAEYVGNYYGTPVGPIEEKLNAGYDVLLEIEVKGALQVKKARPDAVMIFILPPSMEELRSRLTLRGTESPEKIELRLSKAREEMESVPEFRYAVVNDEVSDAARKIESIIEAKHCEFEINRDFPILKGE